MFQDHATDNGTILQATPNQLCNSYIVHIEVYRILGTDLDTCLRNDEDSVSDKSFHTEKSRHIEKKTLRTSAMSGHKMSSCPYCLLATAALIRRATSSLFRTSIVSDPSSTNSSKISMVYNFIKRSQIMKPDTPSQVICLI